MRRGLFTCIALVLSLSAAVSVTAKRQEMRGGTVEYNRGILTVHLAQPTDLRTVLEAICQATESRCDVAASAAEVELPALALTGTWRAVVTQLFEGSGHNYAALEPSGGQGGRLWVEARPPAGPGGAGATRSGTAWAGGEGATESSLEYVAPRASMDEREPTQPDVENDSPVNTAADTGGSPSGPGTGNSGGQAPDPGQQRATEQSLRMLYEGFTAPRPPQPTTGMITLPFVGPDGNFVTVPATNQPITVLPWPGPDGKPITVTPTPGAPLQWPIPATHGTSNPPR